MRSAIGFIGLGLLGGAMARRLVSCGHEVIGYDIAPDRLAGCVASGVVPATSPADVAGRSRIVMACVTTTADVAGVLEGPDGIASAGRLDDRTFVDCSTTEIATTRALAARLLASTGMQFVDAPVSGGPGAAQDGTLAIMAGGPDQVVEAIRPVLQTLGRFTRMGEVGSGQATKLVNQTLVLTNYCVIAEALRLAQAHGVDAGRIAHALETGHAGSNLLPLLLERMIAEDFSPRGYARQVLKDLEMLDQAAREQHLAMPMASQALTMFRMLIAQGNGELDGSAVVTLLPRP